MIEAFEEIHDLAGDGLGGLAVARVVGRLTAAGLGRGRVDDATRLLEELGGGQAHAGTKEIDEAGDEESDADGQALQPSEEPAGWRGGLPNASCPGSGVCWRP